MAEFPFTDLFQLANPRDVALGDGEVHVWAVPLTGDPSAHVPLLSAAERDRAERYRFADHRRRYQISHGALRQILAGYLERMPGELEFRVGPRGKPYLVAAGPFFNLSHSGQLTLIAVGAAELGIDVEKVRRLESMQKIAQRHFSSAEYAALAQLAPEAQELGFYRCWTRKEAYIKALGEGLTMALDSFEVSLAEQPSVLACHDRAEDPGGWALLDVSPAQGYVGAIALRHTGQEPVVKTFRL